MEITIERESQSYIDAAHWVDENITELIQQYASDHELIWIAVFEKEVVAFGPDPIEVRQKAVEKTGRRPNEIFIDFIEGTAAIL